MFDKEIRKCCAYCQHGQPFGEDTVLCEKRGPVTFDHRCIFFRYDPLLRHPAPPVQMKKPKLELNFSLEDSDL